MQHRYGPRLSFALIAATAAIGLVILWLAPAGAVVPVHFSGRWVPDRFATAWHGLLIWIGMLTALWLVFYGIQYCFRSDVGLQASLPVYDLAWITPTAGLCALAVGSMEYAVGIKIALASLNSVMSGVFFLAVGNCLGKIRPNRFLGIRTPWTKANVRVWERTHRTCGPIFILAGIGLIAAGFGMLGLPVGLKLINCFMLGMLLFCYGLSWFYWRQERTRG
ncbi:SdpI family protein [Acetobacter malorum]|uniref:SdpI family protein n=1 Tax=Acetobacter malorum TaxID=178901 RepID=UPI0039EA3CCE